MVRKSLDCRKICTVADVVEYRQEADPDARVTDIEVRILVPESYRMRGYDICGVNAGAEDHQPPDTFLGGGHGGHESVHRTLSRLGRAASNKMDRTAMGTFTECVG